MNKVLFKSCNIFLIFSIIFVTFFSMPNVFAKTMRDLNKELDTLQAEANENENKIEYTEAQIEGARKDIAQINTDMTNISNEIVTKNNEIASLGEQINSKDKEIKDLVEFIQISNGYSFYFEYLMGAETLTDFIYRLSVSEQLSKYNSDLITKMNQMIKDNEARKVELNNKTIELDKKQVELAKSLKVLASQKTQLYENARSLDDEIAVARDVIKMYQEAGCGTNEDLNVCASRLLPSDTRFWRPIARGTLTSLFGYRTYYINGHYVSDYHEGFDMTDTNKTSTKVYAAANGKVAKVFNDKYGGNQVVIHHKIRSNGVYKYYSTTYAHLASVYVKDGSIVTKDNVIGIMGSTGNSTGPHLHFSVSTGLRYKDYVSYSDYVAHSFSPGNVINFPSMGRYWTDRITRY